MVVQLGRQIPAAEFLADPMERALAIPLAIPQIPGIYLVDPILNQFVDRRDRHFHESSSSCISDAS